MSLPYRPNVCMLVYNPAFELWIGERYGSTTWQFPQGGVSKKKTLVDSVVRELREELGVRSEHLGKIEQLEATHRYDFVRTPPRWQGRWAGQEQTFWAVQFVGQDHHIDVTRHRPQEFSRWEWCPPGQVLERVEPIRRPGYEQPLTEYLNKVAHL
ncbi:NUDIX domain-containing protein [bacterium]|nr:NUDIX domain-containing protein [bacterium]